MADTFNPVVDQYAEFSFELVYADHNLSPIDLTGFTADMQIRDRIGGTILDSFDETTGITLGTVDGSITLNIDGTATGGYTWATGVYDLVLTSPTGEKIRLVEGTITMNPGVTH